jgi:hypothetical protein
MVRRNLEIRIKQFLTINTTTRTWVFDDSTPDGKGTAEFLLWISGPPRCGKRTPVSDWLIRIINRFGGDSRLVLCTRYWKDKSKRLILNSTGRLVLSFLNSSTATSLKKTTTQLPCHLLKLSKNAQTRFSGSQDK